jgi:PhnB protein
MQLNPHVNFNGNCEEAFKFYEKHLGGKIEVLMRYEGTPAMGMTPAGWNNKVIHGRIAIGGTTLMGADAPPGRYDAPKGASISLSVTSDAEADRIFGALSEKGTAPMPIQETFFATRFGMVVDQFGIPWMVVHQKTA